MEIRLYVKAGGLTPRCQHIFMVNGVRERCSGHQFISINLDEVAKIRHGENKVVPAQLSCGHHKDDRFVIYGESQWSTSIR